MKKNIEQTLGASELDSAPIGYTRITEALERFTKLDLVNDDVLDEACERGTLVHELCEQYAKNQVMPIIPENVKGYFESFKNWHDTYVSNVISQEQRINCEKWRISGKYDFILSFKNDNRTCLVDLKTSSAKSKTWHLQTAAYSYLYWKKHNIIPDRRGCLMLSKDGKEAKFIEHLDYPKDFSLFFSALALHRFFE